MIGGTQQPSSAIAHLRLRYSASRTAWLACATAGWAFPTEPHLLRRKREWGHSAPARLRGMRLARPARSWRFCRKELAGRLKPPGFSAKLVAAGGFATGLCFRTRGRQRAEALASVSPQSLRLRAWFDGWSVLSVGPENPKSRVDPRRQGVSTLLCPVFIKLHRLVNWSYDSAARISASVWRFPILRHSAS